MKKSKAKSTNLLTVKDFEAYNLLIAREIRRYFRDIVFKGIFDILNNKTITNSTQSELALSIQSGKVFYNNDGSFSGNITREAGNMLKSLGAVKQKDKYYIPFNALPENIRNQVITSIDDRRDKSNRIMEYIDNLDLSLAVNVIPVSYIYSKLASEAESKIVRKILSIGGNIDNYKTDILQDSKYLTDKLHLKIKDFTQNELLDFRQDMQESLQAGNRIKNLGEYIQGKYEFSRDRSNFIATQETRIFLTERQQSRFIDAGIDEFYWVHTDANNPNKRPQHYLWSGQSKKGKKFSFSDPPINPDTGNPELPGEERNCKCIARAVFT